MDEISFQKLLENLRSYTTIIVSGPQRSGTTFFSNSLAKKLDRKFIPEEDFGVHDRERYLEFINEKKTKKVVQCPGMSYLLHNLDRTDTFVIFMIRDVIEILASQERIKWNHKVSTIFKTEINGENHEKLKYILELSNLKPEHNFNFLNPIAELKYDIWDKFQKPLLDNYAEVKYADLKLFFPKMWVEKDKRRTFSSRQISVNNSQNEISKTNVYPINYDFARLHYDNGKGFNKKDSVSLKISHNKDLEVVVFSISEVFKISRLRLDPIHRPALLEIEKISVYYQNGNIQEIKNIDHNGLSLRDSRIAFSTSNPRINFKVDAEREISNISYKLSIITTDIDEIVKAIIFQKEEEIDEYKLMIEKKQKILEANNREVFELNNKISKLIEHSKLSSVTREKEINKLTSEFESKFSTLNLEKREILVLLKNIKIKYSKSSKKIEVLLKAKIKLEDEKLLLEESNKILLKDNHNLKIKIEKSQNETKKCRLQIKSMDKSVMLLASDINKLIEKEDHLKNAKNILEDRLKEVRSKLDLTLKQVEILNQENRDITNSVSYKFGFGVTKPLRVIYDKFMKNNIPIDLHVENREYPKPQSQTKLTKPNSKVQIKIELPYLHQPKITKHGDIFSSKNAKDYKSGVSIIVLNRNGLIHLKEMFKSFFLFNTYKRYEFIIIDHGSHDGSVKYLKNRGKKYPIKIIQERENFTFSYSNNTGFVETTYDKILYLNNDIIFKSDFLKEAVDEFEGIKNIGCLGFYLDYPSKNNIVKVQHSGIKFNFDPMYDLNSSTYYNRYFEVLKNELNSKKSYSSLYQHFYERGYLNKLEWLDYSFFRPENLSEDILQEKDYPEVRICVTAAALLCKTADILKIKGFDECYIYGYEDVDLCLKFKRELNKTNYIANRNIRLIHNESASQKKDQSEDIRNRRINNINVLNTNHYNYLRKNIILDKLNNKKDFTNEILTVGIAVTSDDKNTTAGDFFTAFELSEELSKFGWKVKFLSRDKDWYNLDGIDMLIVLIDAYDLSKVKFARPYLIKIAWARNWFDRWAENQSFNSYDIILSSSKKAIDFYREEYDIFAHYLPIATNPRRFDLEDVNIDSKYSSDLCFTGSYWNADRDIEQFLEPSKLSHKFSVFGYGWEEHIKFRQYNQGFVNYFDIPQIYNGTKILLDDANHVTKKWGSVNSRVFDALAAGKLVLSNGVQGSIDLFDGRLPCYSTSEELHEKIDFFMTNNDERIKLVRELQSEVIDKHTYKHRALKLKKIVTEVINEKRKFTIKVPAPNKTVAHEWGDYHFAKSMRKQFRKHGHIVKIEFLEEWYRESYLSQDVVIVLRGLSEYKVYDGNYNIMWNISHPDKVSRIEYEKYDHIYVASELACKRLSGLLNNKVSMLLQATDPEVFYKRFNSEISKSDKIIFVGNSRNVYRKIVKDAIFNDLPISVYGSRWENLIDEKYIKGTHINNTRLNQYYSSSAIVLNDHWETMSENGFISNRLFDAGACGALIITDRVEGINKVFGNLVIQYKDRNDLKTLVQNILRNPKKYDALRSELRNLVIAKHTFEKRIEKILLDINKNKLNGRGIRSKNRQFLVKKNTERHE